MGAEPGRWWGVLAATNEAVEAGAKCFGMTRLHSMRAMFLTNLSSAGGALEPDHTNGRTPITHTAGVWEASLRLVGYISLAHARTRALTHRSDRSR